MNYLARLARLCLAAALLAGLALTLAPAPRASAAPIAYAVRSDVDDQLYQIDLATGVATAIGAVGFADVEGLTFNCASGLYAVDDITDQLITIDPATGAGVAVGPLGIGGVGAENDFGLTFDTSGNLWLSTDAPGNLYSVNPATGAATLVGAMGQPVTGLAFNGSNGVLYGLGGETTNNLVTLNPASGAAAAVGALGAVTTPDGGIDFDSGGVLWGLNDSSPGPGTPSQAFTINPATGAASVVSSVTLSGAPIFGFEGLAINAPCLPPPTPTPTPTVTPTVPGGPTNTPLPPPPPTNPPPPPPPQPPPAPSLADPSITKAADVAFAMVGDLVQFTVTVANPNSVSLPNIVVVDTLPRQLDLVSATPSQGTFTFDPNPNTLTFTLGSLEAGQTATIVIRTRVNAQAQPGDVLRNVASVFADGQFRGQAEALVTVIPSLLPAAGVGPGWRELAVTALLATLAALLPPVAWWLLRRRRRL